MKNKSSYQARLQDIRILELENEDLRRDIYSFMGENGGFVARASAEAKWRTIIDQEHAITYGERQLRLFEPEVPKGMFERIMRVSMKKRRRWMLRHPLKAWKRRKERERSYYKGNDWKL